MAFIFSQSETPSKGAMGKVLFLAALVWLPFVIFVLWSCSLLKAGASRQKEELEEEFEVSFLHSSLVREQLAAESPFPLRKQSGQKDVPFDQLFVDLPKHERKEKPFLKSWSLIDESEKRSFLSIEDRRSRLSELNFEKAGQVDDPVMRLKILPRWGIRWEMNGRDGGVKLPELQENPDFSNLANELKPWPGESYRLAVNRFSGRVEFCLPEGSRAEGDEGSIIEVLKACRFEPAEDSQAKGGLIWGRVKLWVEREEEVLKK